MPTDKKLKATVNDLEGKDWANVVMGPLQKPHKKGKSKTPPTRRLRARSHSRSRSLRNNNSLNTMRNRHNAANLQKAQNLYRAYKEAKKDPKKVEDKYATYLTCLLLKIGDAPNSMIDDNCKRLLDAGNFKTKEDALAGLKSEFSGKKSGPKYLKFIEKLKSQNDEDSKDLLEELERLVPTKP